MLFIVFKLNVNAGGSSGKLSGKFEIIRGIGNIKYLVYILRKLC